MASLQPAEVVAAPLVWRPAVEAAVFWLPQAEVVVVTLVVRPRAAAVASLLSAEVVGAPLV